jgi:two-component system chemotaxis sensor kinase CheA
MGIRQELDENFDEEIVEDFVDHYTVMIGVVESLILGLNNPYMYRDNVNELFRTFHTIKSATAYLKIDSMQRLSAYVEEVLEILRNREEVASQEVINWFLGISAMYLQWRDDLNEDGELSKIHYKLLILPDLESV